MHIGFLNPQGNFDPGDSYWTVHPDFGGQLVYVKQLSLAMGALGHRVDILTRQIVDPEWREFAEPFDAYPDAPNVRIVRLPAGPEGFLRKELLWPHLVEDWVPNILAFYQDEGSLPDAFTTHYGDGGLAGVLIEDATGVPFTFTAHSLGAQKMDKLHVDRHNLAEMNDHFLFGRRLVAERLSMNRSGVNITSTIQERYQQYTHSAYRGAVDPTNDDRFAVVPPGVAMEIFDKDSRYPHEAAVYDHVRQMLTRDLDADRVDLPCVVASSRLDAKKNHLALVQALAASPELQEHANLVMITGDLDNPLDDYSRAGQSERAVLDQLMDVIEQARLRGKVSMFALRGQGELAAGYRYFSQQQSVFALTAFYEPFGLAPLEAIAAGLPAVVTRNGGPSESLREGDQDFGILVDPNDIEQISAGLFSLVSNRERWEHFAAAGYQRVQERYTWQRTAEGYLDRIEDMVAAPSARRSGRLLPIHPYFRDPQPENDIGDAELAELYLSFEVLSVGEALVDFISEETVDSLRAADRFARYLGGQPANVAVYVAKLGARSTMLACVGEDRFGEFVEQQLQNHGVNTESLRRTDELPTTNIFITRSVGVPDFQVNRGADHLLDFHAVSEDLIARARIVHTSCFALTDEPQRSAIRRALRLARRQDKIVSFDPNYSPRIWPDKAEAWEIIAQLMPYVTIVKPSAEDARRLFDPNLEEDELEELALRDFHDLGADVVVFTRSGSRVTVSDGTSVERVGPLRIVEVQSVTGGSDAFWAGLLVAHLDGKSWPDAVRFAHEVAAVKLRYTGHVPQMLVRDDLYARL